ncbi:hypothetical protein [Aquimarina agarivorans]|uniref:hypothetical protein n=1 Tax=Aquimarina agarivorans TaxID=980584 RepID=UPI000248E793|nr:hypothetical protein [Aquimarina agarivorans]
MKKHSSKTPDENGFSIPKFYFENFQSNLTDKLKKNPNLTNDKELGFNVPKDFHKDFSAQILKKTKPKESFVKILILQKIKYALFAAASIIFCFLLFTNTNKNTITKLIVPTVVDTTNVMKQKIQEQFEINEKDTKMMALFIDDTLVDEYLEALLIEELAFED